MRVHRVGTITLGITMVMIGLVYLAHMVWKSIFPYEVIFRAWPCIFLILGLEILLSNARCKECKFEYDKAGICLTVGMTLFAMVLAFFSHAFEMGVMYCF